MKEVNPNLFVGTVQEIVPLVLEPNEWSIVNCASTYHKTMHDWKSANPSHACYVIHEEPALFSINWVDASARYFDYEGKGAVNTLRMLRFMHINLRAGKKVFVCCDQGQSRAPSVACVYLATQNKVRNESYMDARDDFKFLYPDYNPSFGIQEFLTLKWKELMTDDGIN